MYSLKQARKEKNLEKFIREHEKDAPGDLDKLDNAIRRPVQDKSKSKKETSDQDDA